MQIIFIIRDRYLSFYCFGVFIASLHFGVGYMMQRNDSEHYTTTSLSPDCKAMAASPPTLTSLFL